MTNTISNVGSTPSSIYVASLLYGGWRFGDGGSTPVTITYNFGGAGASTSIDSNTETSVPWSNASFIRDNDGDLANAMNTISRVANVVFQRVPNDQAANITYYAYSNNTSDVWGQSETPLDASMAGGSSVDVFFNMGKINGQNRSFGSYVYTTLIHEIGHALGLAHPHDEGGGSPTFPGVSSANDLGDHGLNQQVFTVMSYNAGWNGAPPQNLSSGHAFGPMAFDIAALQYLYGAKSYGLGNTDYQINQDGGSIFGGDSWLCIYDTGGIDTISARHIYGTFSDHGTSVHIDLRSATLDATEVGGGAVSYVEGVHGGLTIAAGVTIENAIGSEFDDTLIGNSAKNRLEGRFGSDTLMGGDGNDTLIGGAGHDTMTGGRGIDYFDFNALNEMGKTGSARDHILDFKHLQDEIDLRTIDAKTGVAGNQAFKFIGTQAFHGVQGELHIFKQNPGGTANDKTIVGGDVNGDGKVDFQIELKGLIGLTAADFLL